jgi:hypothetical protein
LLREIKGEMKGLTLGLQAPAAFASFNSRAGINPSTGPKKGKVDASLRKGVNNQETGLAVQRIRPSPRSRALRRGWNRGFSWRGLISWQVEGFYNELPRNRLSPQAADG